MSRLRQTLAPGRLPYAPDQSVSILDADFFATSSIDYIDKNTHEIKQDDDKVVYKSLEEISDDLPDHSPRFILLSYPLTLVCFFFL